MAHQPKIQWSWIFDFVTMLTVVIGVTLGAVELRQFRTAQEAQVLLQLFQTLQAPQHVRGTLLIQQMPDSLSVEELAAILTGPDGEVINHIALTFEGIGVMVYRGDVSIEWVDELFRYTVIDSWKKFEPLVLANRERYRYPGLLEWHQWLAERLLERAGEEGPSPAYEAYRDWKPPSR